MNKFCTNCGHELNETSNFCHNCGYKNKDVGAAIVTKSYAGFGIRFVAYLIDGIALFVIASVVGFLIGFLFPEFVLSSTTEEIDLFFNFVGLVISLLYFAILESSDWQGSVGKKILGIQVVNYNEEKVSFGQATGRFFGKILSGWILLIGYIMVGFTENKQGLHDILAKTYVIKKEVNC